MLPSDSLVILYGEEDEGGGHVAGEGKLKLVRMDDGEDLPGGGGGHQGGVIPLVELSFQSPN